MRKPTLRATWRLRPRPVKLHVVERLVARLRKPHSHGFRGARTANLLLLVVARADPSAKLIEPRHVPVSIHAVCQLNRHQNLSGIHGFLAAGESLGTLDAVTNGYLHLATPHLPLAAKWQRINSPLIALADSDTCLENQLCHHRLDGVAVSHGPKPTTNRCRRWKVEFAGSDYQSADARLNDLGVLVRFRAITPADVD